MSTKGINNREEIIQAAEEAGLQDARDILERSETSSMSRSEKIRVYEAYDEGRLEKPAAYALLGNSLETLEENAAGVSNLLQEDSSQFLAD